MISWALATAYITLPVTVPSGDDKGQHSLTLLMMAEGCTTDLNPGDNSGIMLFTVK